MSRAATLVRSTPATPSTDHRRLVIGPGSPGCGPPSKSPRPERPPSSPRTASREQLAPTPRAGSPACSPRGPVREPRRGHARRRGRAVATGRWSNLVVREAPNEIEKLIHWGTQFDQENGALAPHPGRRAQPPWRIVSTPSATSHRVRGHCACDSSRRRRRPRTSPSGATPFTIDLLTHDGVWRRAVVRRNGLGNLLIWGGSRWCSRPAGCGMGLTGQTTNPPGRRPGTDGGRRNRAGADTPRHGVHAVPPHVCSHRGRVGRYLVERAVRARGVPAGRERRPVHARRRAHGRSWPPDDVVARAIFRTMERTQHPERLPRPVAPRPGDGADAVPRHRQGVAGGSGWTSRPTASRSGRVPTTLIGGVTVDTSGRTTVAGAVGGGRGDLQRAARGRTGWRRTACSKGWCMGRRAPGRGGGGPRDRRLAAADPLGDPAAGDGRHRSTWPT